MSDREQQATAGEAARQDNGEGSWSRRRAPGQAARGREAGTQHGRGELSPIAQAARGRGPHRKTPVPSPAGEIGTVTRTGSQQRRKAKCSLHARPSARARDSAA